MRHGSLFSGIGGFDLAAQWMGWTNVFHTEWNEFGQKVLQHHFPNSISYHDIIKTDYSIHNGDIDIITGGFPCQPFSLAGKRKGTDDERYLWHEMLRAVQQIQPTYVVAENVRGLLTIDGGMVFEQVCADLEAEGYEVQPILLPAAGVNAPHRRDRIFIVGYAANTNSRRQSAEEHRQAQSRWTAEKSISNNWQNFPTESAICGRNDGIPDRLDNITFPKVAKRKHKSIRQCCGATVNFAYLPDN
jgi:DNA (cytosine-5)-methyltransferase 1